MCIRDSYEALQSFLRRMESLQLLVQPSDLALKSSSKGQRIKARSTPGVVEKPNTELNLRLSFFDRVADAEPQPKDQDPQRRP